MEEKEAIRKYCIDRAMEMLSGLDRARETGEVIKVAKELESYIASSGDLTAPVSIRFGK